MLNRSRFCPALLLVLGLASCGFQLRGQAQLPPEFDRVELAGTDVYSELGNSLRMLLEANGSQVVAEDGGAVLRILSEDFRRQVTAVGSTGKAREFRLTYRVRFRAERADGGELVAPDEVRLSRDYAYDEDQVLGRNAAEEDLQRQLTREAAFLILQRLQAV